MYKQRNYLSSMRCTSDSSPYSSNNAAKSASVAWYGRFLRKSRPVSAIVKLPGSPPSSPALFKLFWSPSLSSALKNIQGKACAILLKLASTAPCCNFTNLDNHSVIAADQWLAMLFCIHLHSFTFKWNEQACTSYFWSSYRNLKGWCVCDCPACVPGLPLHHWVPALSLLPPLSPQSHLNLAACRHCNGAINVWGL